MDRDYGTCGENPYKAYRKRASKYNDRLASGEKAAELLGISEASLRNHESGVTKVVPNDLVHLMASLYNAPELRSWYCQNECPIGGCVPMATEIGSIESVAISLANSLSEDKIRHMKKTMLEIAEDGQVREDEKPDLAGVVDILETLLVAAHRTCMLAEKHGCK